MCCGRGGGSRSYLDTCSCTRITLEINQSSRLFRILWDATALIRLWFFRLCFNLFTDVSDTAAREALIERRPYFVSLWDVINGFDSFKCSAFCLSALPPTSDLPAAWITCSTVLIYFQMSVNENHILQFQEAFMRRNGSLHHSTTRWRKRAETSSIMKHSSIKIDNEHCKRTLIWHFSN